MKLSKLLCLGFLTLSTSAFSQLSDARYISDIKGNNPNITKVTLGSKDTRREQGVNKTYVTYSAYIKTEYPGITRVYRSQRRYVGSKFEKDLVGNSYYLGMTAPNTVMVEKLLSENKKKYLGNDYHKIVELSSPIKLEADPKYQWANLNATSFLTAATYKIRPNSNTNLVKTVKVVKRASMSRTVDGKTWDPKAKLLTNGIWKFTYVDKTISTEVLKEETLSDEVLKGMHTLAMQEDIERANAYIANLPTVTLPAFKSDKHVIKFVHDLLVEGDAGKIEAAMNQLAPDDYFVNKESYLYNNQGAKFVNDVVAMGETYSTYYCANPQVKAEKYGEVSFLTRDLNGAGSIQVFQAKDKTWKIYDIRLPLYGEGYSNKDVRESSLKAAGDSKCGEPLNIEKPVGPVKYKIGDRVEGMYRNVWYTGTVNKVDNMMADRYYVKYDKINGQWVTTDKMRAPSGQAKSNDTASPTGTPASKSSGNNPAEKKPEEIKKKIDTKKISKLKGLKSKVKIPN